MTMLISQDVFCCIETTIKVGVIPITIALYWQGYTPTPLDLEEKIIRERIWILHKLSIDST